MHGEMPHSRTQVQRYVRITRELSSKEVGRQEREREKEREASDIKLENYVAGIKMVTLLFRRLFRIICNSNRIILKS